MRILTVTTTYLPGFMGGGPIRSLCNLVEHTRGSLEFNVITLNHDHGERTPYPGIRCLQWMRKGNAQVMYVRDRLSLILKAADLLRSVQYDALHLVGMFPHCTWGLLALRKLGCIPKIPVVLGPHGELDPDALRRKGIKKRAFLMLARAMGLYRGITWHACSLHEDEDIVRGISLYLGIDNGMVRMIPNLGPHITALMSSSRSLDKVVGYAKLIFLSRIVPNKNLHIVLQTLMRCTGDIQLDIFGPIEDWSYWQRCQSMIEQLPKNVVTTYHGAVTSDDVLPTLARYHLLFVPSEFENFGYVILEALLAGCIVLTSDKTPWRDLASCGIGWDLRIEDGIGNFARAVAEVVSMSQAEFSRRSATAARFGAAKASSPRAVADYVCMFADAGKA